MPHTTVKNNLHITPQTPLNGRLNKKKFRAGPACDRCRLKKIKCDGTKPNCFNCQKVDIECQTTYKLKRRGTGRGYTRALEIELNELKKLLQKHNITYPDIELSETNDNDIKIEDEQDKKRDNFQIQQIQQNSELENVSDNVFGNVLGNDSENHVSQKKIKLENLKDKNTKAIDNVIEKNNVLDLTNFINLGDWNQLVHLSNDKKTFYENKLFETKLIENQKNLIRSQINSMIWSLNLNDQKNFCPNFLLKNHKDEIDKGENINQILIDCIDDFFMIQNSLLPLLYPVKKYHKDLTQFVENLDNNLLDDKLKKIDNVDNLAELIDFKLNLLLLLYCIQFKFDCLDSLELFVDTRQFIMFLDNSLPIKCHIKSIQVLLVAAYFSLSNNSPSVRERDWYKQTTMGFLHLLYEKLSVTGILYQEYGNVDQEAEKDINQNQNLIAFWCFIFLQHWFTFLFNMPKIISLDKIPYTIADFKHLLNLNQNFLKPFTILLKFTIHDLSSLTLHEVHENNMKKDKLTLELESFRLILKKWKLYYLVKNNSTVNQLDNLDFDLKNFDSLDKSEIIEMKLTFFYLILTLIVDQMNSSNIGKNSEQLENRKDIDKYSKDSYDYVELSFDLLSLYFIIIMDGLKKESKSHFKVKSPCPLVVSHFLPILNYDIILFCINNLISFADKIAPEYRTEAYTKFKVNEQQLKNFSQLEQYWTFIKYKRFMINWCKVWFFTNDNSDNSVSVLRNKDENGSNYIYSTQLFNRIIDSFYIDTDNLRNFNIINDNQLVSCRKYQCDVERSNKKNVKVDNGNKLVTNENKSLISLNRSNFDIIKQLLKSRDDLFNNGGEMVNVADIDTNILGKDICMSNEGNKKGMNDFNLNLSSNNIPYNDVFFHGNDNSNSSSTNNNVYNKFFDNNLNKNQGNKNKNILPLFPEESDEGYIEDDDEDDEDIILDNKPLEIKFNTRNRKNVVRHNPVRPNTKLNSNKNDYIKESSADDKTTCSTNSNTKFNDNMLNYSFNKRKFDRLEDENNIYEQNNANESMGNLAHQLLYKTPKQFQNNFTRNNSSIVIKAIPPQQSKSNLIYGPPIKNAVNSLNKVFNVTNENNALIDQNNNVNQSHELLLPNFIPTDESMNNTYIKSPLASTLYLQNSNNNPHNYNQVSNINGNNYNNNKNHVPARLLNNNCKARENFKN